MELPLVIYLSVGIIFFGTLLFGLFFYMISKTKYSHTQKPYKISLFENTGYQSSSTLPGRHLRKRKFYRTNFADTIELKKKKTGTVKKNNLKEITKPKLTCRRFSIINDNYRANPQNTIDNVGEFDFKSTRH